MRRLVGVMLALGAGCGDAGGPMRIAILDADAGGSAYRLRAADVDTLESLSAVRGESATVLGGARLVFDYERLDFLQSQGKLGTVGEWRDEVLRKEGKTPRASFTPGHLDGEAGVLVADDFDSLAMITAYHHLERAREGALALGMPETCLVAMTTYYDIEQIENFGAGPVAVTDNAAYVPLLNAFILPPFGEFPFVPMPMNPGIMAHEYSHGVWGCIIHDESPNPFLELVQGLEGTNLLRSMNEGVADFLAASFVSDPNFIDKSIPGIGEERDMSETRLATSAMLDAAATEELYDPYPLGAVLASSLWKLRRDAPDPDAIGRAVLASLVRLRTLLEGSVQRGIAITLTDYLGELAASVEEHAPTEHARACSILSQRFAVAGTVPGC